MYAFDIPTEELKAVMAPLNEKAHPIVKNLDWYMI
jgi:hypothetical protein